MNPRALRALEYRWFADLRHFRETGAVAVSLAVPAGVPMSDSRIRLVDIAKLLGLKLRGPRGPGQPMEMVGAIKGEGNAGGDEAGDRPIS